MLIGANADGHTASVAPVASEGAILASPRGRSPSPFWDERASPPAPMTRLLGTTSKRLPSETPGDRFA
jgi:hypothetical protein